MGVLVNGHKPSVRHYPIERDAALRRLIQGERYKDAFIAMLWPETMENPTGPKPKLPAVSRTGYVYDNGKLRLGGGEAVEAALRDTIALLKANGVERVHLVMTIPTSDAEVPQEATALSVFHGLSEAAINARLGRTMHWYHERNDRVAAMLKSVAGAFDGIDIIDPTDALCPDGQRCRVVQGGHSLYSDGGHLSVSGANLLKPMMENAIKNYCHTHP